MTFFFIFHALSFKLNLFLNQSFPLSQTIHCCKLTPQNLKQNEFFKSNCNCLSFLRPFALGKWLSILRLSWVKQWQIYLQIKKLPIAR